MQINKVKLIEEIRNIHPFYDEKAIEDIADNIMNNLNDDLTEILGNYLENGSKKDYEHKEFSLFMIHNGLGFSYLESIILMNEYIKDNEKGKSMILARRNK